MEINRTRRTFLKGALYFLSAVVFGGLIGKIIKTFPTSVAKAEGIIGAPTPPSVDTIDFLVKRPPDETWQIDTPVSWPLFNTISRAETLANWVARGNTAESFPGNYYLLRVQSMTTEEANLLISNATELHRLNLEGTERGDVWRFTNPLV